MYTKKHNPHNPQIHRTIMHKSTFMFLITLLSSQVLLVASQSTANNTAPIDNRTCKVDLDCVSVNVASELQRRLGNFMCIQSKCKFVVTAGQQCREATDCVAYHYSNLHSIFLGSDICSPKHCVLESKCDGAWDQKDISSIPQIEKQSNCCIGLPTGSMCNIVANDVDPCDSNNCLYDKETKSSKCSNKDQNNKPIWIGVLICLLGSTTLNIGLNIQKYAFTKHEALDKQQMADIVDDDDNNSRKNSNLSIHSVTNTSTLYGKLEKFMFWKQIFVSPLWTIGLGIYIFGNLLNFAALQFAPQSLIAPLGAVSLVVNLLIAPILHHQKLTTWDIIGVVIIICGSVIITAFAGIVAQDYKLCVLIELFKRSQTIIYLSVISIFIFALFTFVRVVERNAIRDDENALAQVAAAENKLNSTNNLYKSIPTMNVDKEDASTKVGNNRSSYRLSIKFDDDSKGLSQDIDQTLELAVPSGKVGKVDKMDIEDEISPMPLPRNSISSIRTNRSVVRQRSIKEKVLLPLAYAILASSMATITTLFAKSLINLLTVSFTQRDNQFNNLLSWTILIITVSTAIGQVYWINMGLKKYDALLQVPIFYCNWSLFDIIGGGIYYDEFRHFGTIQYVGFIIGVSLIFFGVSLLSKRLAMLTKEERELQESQKKWGQENKMKKKSVKKQ